MEDNQMDLEQSVKIEPKEMDMKQPDETLQDSLLKNGNNDVQRAIEGLRDIPDEELQEFFDDEDFMKGLDVVDAWEGEEDKNQETKNKADNKKQEKTGSSREQRQRERKESYSREKPKKGEKREEVLRRDPAKSSKDIERDKIRTKRDTESKLLAEKEKAIKHLLDSDNVVPPGTETEAIQSITEKQNMERAQQRERRSKERRRSVDRYGRSSPPRRRTPDKLRSSPHRRRSPFVISPERRRSPFNRTSTEKHRSPARYSPGKRRNSPRYVPNRRSPAMSPERNPRSPKRFNWDRRSSLDRKYSPERQRRRADVYERRRSRSRDRRSRSMERSRRRSSRSPANRRYSPRRRSHTRSRSPEKRAGKRPPFIKELARQLRNEAMKPTDVNSGYVSSTTMNQVTPLFNAPTYQQETSAPRPPLEPPPYIHQPDPLPPPPPPMSMVPPMPVAPPMFMNFEIPVVPMTFEQSIPQHTLLPTEYSSGPVMYNQPNTVPIQEPCPSSTMHLSLLPTSMPSPQPVPAPTMDHGQLPYNPPHGIAPIQQSPVCQFESTNKPPSHSTATSTSMPSPSYKDPKPIMLYSQFHAPHEERLKTPEPPIISKSKQSEKTSLSSLLEASVSAKSANSTNIPMLYPGFKPEIIRYCEQVLCQLPIEDPRLKMKGRFFFARDEEDTKQDSENHTSNSILLQRGKNKICWEENIKQQIPIVKSTAQMHQKICQTELETETKGTQVQMTDFTYMVDFASQVYSEDIEQANKEERRSAMDRINWDVRETYEYAPKYRGDDLRWSLNNSSQRRFWNKQPSPSRRSDEHERERHLDYTDHGYKNTELDPAVNNRDSYSGHEMREHYDISYSPDYTCPVEHDRRSDHSLGESPMELENSDDDLGQLHSDWRGKMLRGRGQMSRGKHSGGKPSYRSRGSFRGKF